MPRVSSFRISAIDELYRQLKYAPRAARRRQMEAAERLAREIDATQLYPQDFVIFRITGYRPEASDPAPALVGEALVGDLAAFIQHLSHSLDLASDGQPRSSLALGEAARRLNVSTKTLQRYRRRGLVCHYLVFPDGVKRLACFEDALQRFVDRNRDHVGRAAAFTRVGDDAVERMVRDARETHRQHGLSLGATARRLAGRYGRSPETMRAILKRHDRRAPAPIFGEAGPVNAREARLICRAARRGLAVSTVARRLRRPVPTVHRVINVGRRRDLDRLDLAAVPLRVLDDPDATAALVRDPLVATGLVAPEPELDALRFIAAARSGRDPDRVDREAATILAGYNLLKRRAAAARERLPAYPAGAALDAIETDLRWATLLKRRLAGLAMTAAVAAVDQFVGRPVDRQPREEIVGLVRLAIDVVSASLESIDPDRGQRVSHVCAYAMSRALAAQGGAPPAGRAGTKHRPEGVVLDRPFERICPWQPALDLRADLRSRVERLAGPGRDLVAARYGLAGDPPRSLAELGRQTGRTPAAVARLIAGAQNDLRAGRRTDR